jgi:branched-chain amino acid transport system substrate-binding protein
MFAQRSAGLAAIALAAVMSIAHPQAAGAQGELVRIGVLNDQSGVFSDVTGQGSVIAARLAIEDFGGSVLGHKVELLSADHQNKTDVAASITRRWIDVDNVLAIVDGGSSGAALAIQEIVKEKGRIAMFSGPATSDLTGKACSPQGFHWTYDTYALANSLARGLVKSGADTWFFLTSDYAFGHALERDATRFIEASGGKVIGRVRHPLNTADFSSFILQAQASKAKIIGFANSGDDALNAVKQAAEFGVTAGGQRIGGLLLLINQIHGLGLNLAKGTVVAESFYWNLDDGSRNFSRRFEALANKKPNMIQAGVYSAVTHLLKSIQAAQSVSGPEVAETMRKTPVNDFMSKNVAIRGDGRVLRDMHLFEVKAPGESSGPWDYYKLVSTVPGDAAFRPVSESDCPLLKK